MTKYLALFVGSASEDQKRELSPDQSRNFMEQWASWAQAHERSIVDGGLPLGKTRHVSADGISDTQNQFTAFTIVEAATHEDAAKIFEHHPHLKLLPGNAVDIMECLTLPSAN